MRRGIASSTSKLGVLMWKGKSRKTVESPLRSETGECSYWVQERGSDSEKESIADGGLL